MKLLKGDCLELMKSIPDGSVDMILTDPPYGTTRCVWDSIIPLEPMWVQLKRIIKPNGAIVLFCSQPFTSVLISSNFSMFKQSLIWSKNKSSGHLNAKKRHMVAHEDIVLFSKKQVVYNPQKTSGHKKVKGYIGAKSKTDCYGTYNAHLHKGYSELRYPTTILQFNVVNNDSSGDGRFHPTQKPVGLMEYLIKTYTIENETVLDFTMGSGTTGVACGNLNRGFIGIELDETYFNLAKYRINKMKLLS